MHKTLEAITCHTCGKAELKESSFCSDATLEQYVCSDCHDEHYPDKDESKIEHCNDCKQESVFRINEYQDPFYVDGVRLKECIQCGRYETPQKSVLPSEQDEETQADGFWKEPTVDSRNFPKRLTEREELEEQHGQVWNTKELQQDFTVQGFASPCVVVIRKSDGTKGTLEFIHQPRFYFDFVAG